MRVNEAVVISLPSRHDRLAAFSRSLPHPWPFPALKIHPGVTETPPPRWKSSAGAWGCAQAHLQVLRDIWARGVESTLVLEDDAEFTSDFVRIWEDLKYRVPQNWHMLMLGGQHVGPTQPVGRHWLRCTETRRTHAYVIRLRAVPQLIRTWENTSRHIDHALGSFQRIAHVYAPARFLIGQAAGASDISGLVHEEPRYWQPV
jgi:hypothetical protein